MNIVYTLCDFLKLKIYKKIYKEYEICAIFRFNNLIFKHLRRKIRFMPTTCRKILSTRNALHIGILSSFMPTTQSINFNSNVRTLGTLAHN